MPFLSRGDSPHITAGSSLDELASWIDDGATIPSTSPHTRLTTHFGCTINRSFNFVSTRSKFVQGMQGQLIEEKVYGNEKKAKIFIQGVTGTWVLDPKTQKTVWVNNEWVSANDVWKGKPWRSEFKDWPIHISLDALDFNATQWSTLGRTIHALLTAFHHSPAYFMGSKFEDLIQKRSIDFISKAIIKGIREAGLYDTLNDPDFGWRDLVGAATHDIDDDYTQETGGVYMRVHRSDSLVTHWKPNTHYAYVGKTVDFHDRWQGHKSTASTYGELTQNSASLYMFAVCILHKEDLADLAHLVEQIFVCLCQTYRSLLFLDRASRSDASGLLSAIGHAKYFTDIASHVFEQTGWHGTVSREGFGVYEGANFSSPLEEWMSYSDQILFIRTDTRIKVKENGKSIPVAIFPSVKPRELSHASAVLPGQTTRQVTVWEKRHGKHGGVRLNFRTDSKDGTKAPLANVPYHLIVEVYTDGSRHPRAWSRLSGIGPFSNWEQASSFAFRIEWEHPPNSGQWRTRYIQTSQMFRFVDTSVPGALKNYATAIAFLQWLFDKTPNHSLPWIPRLAGRAYVLADLTSTTRRVIVKELKSGHLKLQKVGGEFGKFSTRAIGEPRKECDVCTMLPDVAYANGVFKKGCKRVGDSNVCQVCEMLGRPCCTWTVSGGIQDPAKFTTKEIIGASEDPKALSAEDLAHRNIVYPALIHQFYSIYDTANPIFSNNLVELELSGRSEEDPADIQVTSDGLESDESDESDENPDDSEDEF